MGPVIGDLLPLAAGVAISPVPIIAAILMLLGTRAGSTSLGFTLGWLAGIIGATIIFVLLGGATDISNGSPSTASSWIKLALGLLLLTIGMRQWRGRSAGDATPMWMAAIDEMTAVKALAIGFALAAVNPKNLLMCAAAGVTIGSAALSTSATIVAVTVFSMLAAVTIVLPVLAYHLAAARLRGPLAALKQWLQDNNTTVMGVLLLVIGVVLVGKGLGGLI